MEDPSRKGFCEFVSGLESSSLDAARGMAVAGCDMLEELVDDFDRESCQTKFCTSGVEGYVDFNDVIIGFLRERFNIIAGVLFFLLIIQCEQMRLVKMLYQRRHQEEKDAEDVERTNAQRRRESALARASNVRRESRGISLTADCEIESIPIANARVRGSTIESNNSSIVRASDVVMQL